MIWQICLLLFAIWNIVHRYKMQKVLRFSKQLKTDAMALPILGHAYKFIGNDEDLMKAFEYFGRQAIKYDGLAKMWLADSLFVIIADPVIAEHVLKTFLGKSEVMRFLRDVIGNGSIFASVEIWRPRRKILAPNFSQKNLNAFVEIFNKQSQIMCEELKAKIGTGPFSVWDYHTTYSMDSVCESTLGIKANAQKNHDHPFLKHFEMGSELVAARVICPWLHSNAIYRLLPAYKKLNKCKIYLNQFVAELIDAKRKSMETEKRLIDENRNSDETKNETKQTNIKTFLEMLIEASEDGGGYSDVELREEAMVLLMAGTDTSAVGSSFATLMMARHQDVQEKVYQELVEVFGNSSRPVAPEDLARLKYLDAVIKESLRLYPPAPVIVRRSHIDGTLPTGITLVKGCDLLINIFAVHRNPKYWGPDAEEFRPERFLDTPLKHPAQFMAFSYGPRNCLGYQYAMMSMKTALATLLRQYRVLPDAEPKPVRVKFDIMMKHVDKFKVRIERRVPAKE